VWPEDPLEVLWHAQTLLREFRGDGHIVQLVAHDLDGTEAVVMHEATGELPPAFLRATRGWNDDEWEGATERLASRGLIRSDPATGVVSLTEAGAALRQTIEDGTDRLSVVAYEAIGADSCDRLRELVRPFARTVFAASGMGG